MTTDEIIAKLANEGWQVWNISQHSHGGWSVRIVDPVLERRTNGARGPTGFDRECWRTGKGPTLPAALGAAAVGILTPQPPMEEALDLAAMLS